MCYGFWKRWVIMDEVATIVMGKVTAQRLLEGLKEMLEDEVV